MGACVGAIDPSLSDRGVTTGGSLCQATAAACHSHPGKVQLVTLVLELSNPRVIDPNTFTIINSLCWGGLGMNGAAQRQMMYGPPCGPLPAEHTNM